MLGFVEIPKHSSSVLAAGSAERAIGRDGDSVDVAAVAAVVGLDTARRKLPNLVNTHVNVLLPKSCMIGQHVEQGKDQGIGEKLSHRRRWRL